MEKLDKVGKYEFLAEPFHCDFTHRLFLGHLGNHLLNAADFHSNERNFGMDYLNPRHMTWVLSRLSIEVSDIPMAHDRFYIETWVEGAMKFFTNRNFKIQGVNGNKVYGYGRSVWAMIDTETRQPVNLLSIHGGVISDYVLCEKECPIAKYSHAKMDEKAEFVRSIVTNYSDIDINGHVNSAKYIEHILDLWDTAWYETNHVARLEIAYVAESHWGDTLNFYRERSSDNEFCVRITKKSPDSDKDVEVCRGKVRFLKGNI